MSIFSFCSLVQIFRRHGISAVLQLCPLPYNVTHVQKKFAAKTTQHDWFTSWSSIDSLQLISVDSVQLIQLSQVAFTLLLSYARVQLDTRPPCSVCLGLCVWAAPVCHYCTNKPHRRRKYSRIVFKQARHCLFASTRTVK